MTPAGTAPAGVGFAGRWRLVMCDVDSTLITEEVIELLADRAGSRAEVERMTSAAMSGTVDFAESLTRRVALLEGLDESALDEVGRALTLTPGAETLLRTLKRDGVLCGIASGGFTQVCAHLVDRLDLDYCAANTLEVDRGKLTGRVVGPIVDRAGKAAALREFAGAHDIDLAHTVAIGDGANDIDMLCAAGFSIAFNPKAALAPHASATVHGPSLEPVLDLLRHAAGSGDPAAE